MRKYYFAYHSVNGIIFPFTWAEDDGICVGGRPNPIDDSKVEITKYDAELDLGILERMYPIKLPSFTS